MGVRTGSVRTVPLPAVAGPLVERGWITFRVPDSDGRLARVRLVADRGVPVTADEFEPEGDEWALRLRVPELDRFEYTVELEHVDGGREQAPDPANPLRAPGAFGEKSVVELPGYTPPAWVDAERVDGRTGGLAVWSNALGGDVHVTLWCPEDAGEGEPLPLLVAHDGPELDRLAMLTRYSAAQVAAGRLPRHRVALLEPGDRDQWYSASALYARALATLVLPAIRDAVAITRPVGMGVSLGALAMLHVQRRFPAAFDGLFLQSGSFFLPRFDPQESGFVRWRRIVRFVRTTLRERPRRAVPVALTCGALEENVQNNRVVAAALAGQGYPGRLSEVRDLHNFTAWRDAFHPHLTELLRRVWRDAS